MPYCYLEFFDTYESEEGFVGAFPVYKEAGGKIVGYRPTDNTCLMREMQSKHSVSVQRSDMEEPILKDTNDTKYSIFTPE